MDKKKIIYIIIGVILILALTYSAYSCYYSNPVYVLECVKSQSKEAYDSCMYLNHMINK